MIVLRSKLRPEMNQIKTTIRDVTSEDTKALISLCEAIGLFQSNELEELSSMLSTYFEDSLNEEHRWLTEEKDGKLIGIVYYAKEKFAYGVVNLLLIGVHPDHQREGRGT